MNDQQELIDNDGRHHNLRRRREQLHNLGNNNRDGRLEEESETKQDSSPCIKPSEQGSVDSQRHHGIFDYGALILVFTGLMLFATSFFLAKRSLGQTSQCHEAVELLQTELGLTPKEVDQLQRNKHHNLANPSQIPRSGCWMDRKVDAMIILLVDALRFDFAYYNLPNSIGKRLPKRDGDAVDKNSSKEQKHSRLFQFVADPPTVTMQRLKALTTGGLPTFADISANFGGGTVEEDSWIQQLLSASKQESNYKSRDLQYPTKAAFVGDDTWEDLFPKMFTESYPYPSFNTRDLDTVDNGCLKHIPDLLGRIRKRHDNHTIDTNDNEFEVMVVHFLGVDHVGHTYGPHNKHMDAKLKQMDTALTNVLEIADSHLDTCHAVLIFGDHGMTPDGNHGGGTAEETNAALFVHTSTGCPDMLDSAIFLEQTSSSNKNKASAMNELPSEWRVANSEMFTAIHQIDLVPTISLLLGLPIPYANLGSLVPSIIPGLVNSRYMVTSLALNAAQVWRYFSIYSATANKLPNLPFLQDRLKMAVASWREALELDSGENTDEISNPAANDKYIESASLFKLFLSDALDLGQQVWTRFDTVGMVSGIALLALGLLMYSASLFISVVCAFSGALRNRSGVKVRQEKNHSATPRAQYFENCMALIFMLFQCVMLTFSNSYILEEEHTMLYGLAVLSLLVSFRLLAASLKTTRMKIAEDDAKYKNHNASGLWIGLLLIPICARLHEMFVSGHGLDPSIRGVHVVHHEAIFLTSCAALTCFRWSLYHYYVTFSRAHSFLDCCSILSMAASWWEKRSLDHDRNGYVYCQFSIVLVVTGIVLRAFELFSNRKETKMMTDSNSTDSNSTKNTGDTVLILSCKLLILIMIFTGPSTGTSMTLFSIQTFIIYKFTTSQTPKTIGPAATPLVIAALWKLVTRHAFFATNHGCFFNRLQYSAAFVSHHEFDFVTGGIALFTNTFGWEIAGLMFIWMFNNLYHDHHCKQNPPRMSIWRIYCILQYVEALASCISVSVLRRHLMVWDIYAPHFIFTSCFTVINLLFQVAVSFCC